MLNPNKRLRLNIQRFADGGSDGAAAAGSAQGAGLAGEMALDAAKQNKGRNSNPLADIKYGKQAEGTVKQDDAAGKADDTQDRVKKYAEFKQMFKNEYDAEVQGIVQSRLKKSKETEAAFQAISPMLDMLAHKYGVDSSDVETLRKAIEEDDSYYEQEALEKGLTVEQLKSIKKMERENAELKKLKEEVDRRDNANKLYAQWMKEAEELKEIYPAFDLEAELGNEKFMTLLKAPGVNVQTAFEVAHKDEIIPAAMQFAVNKAEEKLTNNIRAQGARPTENGLSSQAAAVVKTDPSTWSKADRDEVERRVMRGEKIKL